MNLTLAPGLLVVAAAATAVASEAVRAVGSRRDRARPTQPKDAAPRRRAASVPTVLARLSIGMLLLSLVLPTTT